MKEVWLKKEIFHDITIIHHDLSLCLNLFAFNI